MMSWVLACPAAAMAYLQRILPWKITRPSARNAHPGESRQSPNSHRHRPPLGTPSSSTNTITNISGSSSTQPNEPTSTRRVNYTAFNALDDNFSAGSGSETRSKSRTKRKSNNRVNTTTVPHIDRNASSSSLLAAESPSISPSVSSAPSPTPSPSPSPLAQPQESPSASSSDPIYTSTAAIEGATAIEQPETSATYETEDNENDFISTQDRRRRRKANALRTSSANQSSESITKVLFFLFYSGAST